MKKLLTWVFVYGMALAYILAGLNHFINPEFYIPLIPPYFTEPELLNLIAGVVEVLFGLMVLVPDTRKYGSLGVIIMLIAFIPSHWYMIEMEMCLSDDFCFDPWLGWVRLLIIHPLLIAWAWWVSKH
jgi:uncharacterized membrane protein